MAACDAIGKFEFLVFFFNKLLIIPWDLQTFLHFTKIV